MKTLFLLRHAKSSWKDEDLDDFDRPLSPRGLRDAPRMGRYMAREGIRPDLVLCSPARRTSDTWTLVARQSKTGDVPFQLDEGLYGASAEHVLKTIRETASEIESLMVVGHNPGLGELAQRLAGEARPGNAIMPIGRFPTCALAGLSFDRVEWSGVAMGEGHLDLFVRPADLDSR